MATLSDSVKKRQISILSQKQQKLRLGAEGKLIPQWSRNSHACGNDYDFVTIFKCGVFFELIFGKWEFSIPMSCQIYFIPKLFISCQFNPHLLLLLLTRMSIHAHSMPKIPDMYCTKELFDPNSQIIKYIVNGCHYTYAEKIDSKGSVDPFVSQEENSSYLLEKKIPPRQN